MQHYFDRFELLMMTVLHPRYHVVNQEAGIINITHVADAVLQSFIV